MLVSTMLKYIVFMTFSGIPFFLATDYNAVRAEEQVPNPKNQYFINLPVKIGSQSQLRLPKSITNRYQAAINSLKANISALPGTDENILIMAEIIDPSSSGSLSLNAAAVLKKRESYVLEITDKQVMITGSDDLGLLHGLTTLEYLITKNKGNLHHGIIMDWPDHKIRALHVVLRMVSPDDVKTRVIRPARTGHFNTIILEIADGVRFSSMEQTALDDAWSKDKFLEVMTFARQNGLEVVPGMNLLTHQEKLLKNKYPELLFNKATYDPGNEKTYDIVLSMVNEVLDLVKPKAMHIGHDEVAGHNDITSREWLQQGEEMLPAELFLKDVVRLYNHLNKRGVTTWMWGDMLIASSEFPTMDANYLHGGGGYSGIRKSMPRKIVICDGHYTQTSRDFPSTLRLAKEGFKVLGTTWWKSSTTINYSKYVASMEENGEGMIATTWFHVQRRNWKLVADIIKTSAEAFWNAK